MTDDNLSGLFSIWLLADSCSIEPLKSNYMALETRFDSEYYEVGYFSFTQLD